MTWEQEMRIQAEERAQELAPLMAQELAKNLVKEEVEEKTRETARKMLSKNIPEDVVAECTGLKLSDVNKLLKGLLFYSGLKKLRSARKGYAVFLGCLTPDMEAFSCRRMPAMSG